VRWYLIGTFTSHSRELYSLGKVATDCMKNQVGHEHILVSKLVDKKRCDCELLEVFLIIGEDISKIHPFSRC
jgi:hypothetical protein